MNLELNKGWLVDPIEVTMSEVFYRKVELKKYEIIEDFILVYKNEKLLLYPGMFKVFNDEQEALVYFNNTKSSKISFYEIELLKIQELLKKIQHS